MKTVAFHRRESCLLITSPYEIALLPILRDLDGGGWDKGLKCWRAALTPGNVKTLLRQGFTFSPEAREAVQRRIDLSRQRKQQAAAVLEVPGLKRSLRPFQEEGLRYIEAHSGRALLADEMGLGKTVQALAYLQLHPELRPAVIVCPACVKLNWACEAAAWTADPPALVLEGRKAEAVDDAPLLIVNYDILPGWVEELRQRRPRAVVLDECHYTKNRKAARTKAVKDLCEAVPHVLALSGTPILSRPIEFYETLALLAPRIFGNWWWYINQFCGLSVGYGGAMNTGGASNTDKLHALLKQHVMIRRLKADVLPELPPKSRTKLPLSITNRTEYNRAALDFRGWLREHEGRELDGGVALARLEALRQLSLAGKMAEALAWIRDTLESVEKLVIFTWHREALAELRRQFATISTSLDGDTPPLQRNACVQRFQQDPDCRLFLGNIKAAGVGITLTAASHVAFLELPWTPGEVVQAEDRLHRIGQGAAVNVWFLLAQGTVDEDIHALLDDKLDTVSGILDGKGASLNILPDLLWRFKLGRS